MSAKGQPQDPVAGDGLTCLATQIKASPFQQGDDSDRAEIRGSQVQLPEDILRHIHSFMQMQDAAQAACVSRSFLHSWSCYPKLMLSVDSLHIKEDASVKDEISREFISRVDHILQNHSGMGVKTFSLHTYPCSDLHHSYVDRWLQIAITPGIENFELSMFGRRDIKGPNMYLTWRCIACEEVDFRHDHSPGALYYARTKLPLIVPNVRTLVLSTRAETVNTPLASCELLQLKYLEIVLCAPIFPSDYFFYSLVSFVDASPVLETYVLRIAIPAIRPDSIIEDSGGDFSRPRCLSEQCHDRLKNVMITGFCSAKLSLQSILLGKQSHLCL